MLIRGTELDDQLVVELGKFAILWNCFERFQCDKMCSSEKIRTIAPVLHIDKEKQAALAAVLNKRRSWFGQIIPEYVERSNYVIKSRKLLPNEVEIDVAGKAKEEVLAEAIRIIDAFKPEKDYAYELDDEHNYLSWVQSRKLF